MIIMVCVYLFLHEEHSHSVLTVSQITLIDGNQKQIPQECHANIFHMCDCMDQIGK